MKERVLVTAALPYANGYAHLGHLVEYVQTDVYVRFRKLCGDEAIFVCAADSHGTPIEVNAAREKMSPKEFVEKYRAAYVEDFQRFDVDFTIFYTTDSPENEKWSARFFDELKAHGLIEKRPLEQLYCGKDQRFLPDRFVKGTCPYCGSADQYGDACEKCGRTYEPKDLKAPFCVICGTKPAPRTSEHYYVTLAPLEQRLRAWVSGETAGRPHLFPAVREQVLAWLDDLQDWCVSRDPPYFGFKVPGDPSKYLYVWLDAPIGYVSSTERLVGPDDVVAKWWGKDAPCTIEHFIGKDIVRFHAVFWPAMLMNASLKTPARVNVHGHLTVNGEKMSKSRGTFVTARTYLESGLDPQLLRYYYAANLGPGPDDLDLSLEEFKNRVNADLAKNLGNLASRVYTLVQKAGGGGAFEAKPDEALRQAAIGALARARVAYRNLELRDAVRAIADLGSACNKALQDQKPWEDPTSEKSRALLYSLAKCLRAVALGLTPVLPRFAGQLFASLGEGTPEWTEAFDPFDRAGVNMPVPPPKVAPMEPRQVEKLIVTTPPAPPEAPMKAGKAAPPPPPGVIQYDDFAKVELKVGLVKAAEAVAGADKLLKLTVDVGEPEPRTIAAGIAKAYKPEELVGKRIVVVANLAPRPLRGVTSQGMLLAAGEPPNLSVVTVADSIAPGTKVK